MTPMPLFCVRSISYVRAYNTNERNTYTNNPDPTDSTRRHSPIKQWYFFLFLQVEVPFLSITVFSIRRLMFSSGLKPGKTCRQHRCFLLDCRCFRSEVPISVVSTAVSGLMVVSIIVVWDRCVAIVEIPIFCHHMRVLWCCLEIWWCCCIWYNGWSIFISGIMCRSDR